MLIKEPSLIYFKRSGFISPSSFKSKKTMWEYKFDREHPESDKKWSIEGRSYHTTILEPENFENEFLLKDYTEFENQKFNKDGTISMQSKANRETRMQHEIEAMNENKTLIYQIEYDNMKEIVSFWDSQMYNFSKFINPKSCYIEHSFYVIAEFDENDNFVKFRDLPSFDYECKDNEMFFKTRPDVVHKKGSFVHDLKTCKSGNPHTLKYEVYSLGYDIQISIGIDIASVVLGLEIDTGMITFCEKTRPYHAHTSPVSENMILSGRTKYQKRLSAIKKAKKTGIYKGYDINSEYDNSQYEGFPVVEFPNEDYPINLDNINF